MMANPMSKLEFEIQSALNGRSPLIYIQTSEEKRIVSAIASVVAKFAKKLHKWNCISGLNTFGTDTKNPVVAINTVIASNEPGIFVFSDLADFFSDPQPCRALKEFALSKKAGKEQFIFILSAQLKIPINIEKDTHLLLPSPPDRDEIRIEFNRIKELYPEEVINKNFEEDIVNALTGLALPEIESILHRVFRSEKSDKDSFFDYLFTEKQAMIRKSGYLEFVPPRQSIESMGGLGNLKEWLVKRQKIFSKEAMDANIPVPKGLLMMGISGCGKSMAVKTIPTLWKVPLYRLDMNLIFSGIYGSPEASFHNALRSLETVSPAILWIDEIENALGMTETELKISTHIFSSFLTWMQEKPPLIFVAATANRIQALPAEVIRKGRFDQIFFVDLPTDNERKDIFKIYLEKHHSDISKFDLKMLGILTKGWNGAEIEQVIAEARTDAFYEDRPFHQADITNNINKTVPLSTTMEAQIKAIKNWAISRATPASGEGKILHY